MKKVISGSLLFLAMLTGAFACKANAQVAANSAVFPAVTVPGGTVVLHAGFTNSSSSLSPVTATVTVNNPGECVSDKVNGGALALQLGPHQTRLATLTTTVPSSACAGTYTVIVTVKNSSGTVIASHKTTFTVDPAR